MKNLIIIFTFLICLTSCQEEELVVIDQEQEASFLQDIQLTSLLKGVSSHDGSFDDIIDQSPCFSINLPYQVLLNNEPHTIKTVDDLLQISENDEVTPIYPITITYATYEQLEVVSPQVLASQIAFCNQGNLYNERITCIDFVYPINVQLYNPETSDFETVVYDHDKRTFESIISYSSNQLASIKFPIALINQNGEEIPISSNTSLKTAIQQVVPICN